MMMSFSYVEYPERKGSAPHFEVYELQLFQYLVLSLAFLTVVPNDIAVHADRQ